MGQIHGVKSVRVAHAGAARLRYSISPNGRWVIVCVSAGAVDVVDAVNGGQLATLCLQDNLPGDMGT